MVALAPGIGGNGSNGRLGVCFNPAPTPEASSMGVKAMGKRYVMALGQFGTGYSVSFLLNAVFISDLVWQLVVAAVVAASTIVSAIYVAIVE